jgi:hypothetical protein
MTPHGIRYGMALRDTRGQVAFRDDLLGTWTALDNTRIADLILCGDVALADAQRIADGDVFAWIERRNTEHAKVA